jgi:hypothetical protein
MNDEVLRSGQPSRRRTPQPPLAEPFLWRWSDDELESLKKGAKAQLIRQREVWSATNSDDERARLKRRIESLADLVLKIEHLQRERAKATRAAEKTPDSPA